MNDLKKRHGISVFGTGVRAVIPSEEYILTEEATKKFLEISNAIEQGKTIELNINKIEFETLDSKKRVIKDIENAMIKLSE